MPLTSKERVLLTLGGQEADRVPVNYLGNPGIDRRLKEHFGVTTDDGLLEALGVDFRSVGAPYAGPKLNADLSERGVLVDNWGIHRCWIEHETGGYWDYCDFPLREADEETAAAWPSMAASVRPGQLPSAAPRKPPPTAATYSTS